MHFVHDVIRYSMLYNSIRCHRKYVVCIDILWCIDMSFVVLRVFVYRIAQRLGE